MTGTIGPRAAGKEDEADEKEEEVIKVKVPESTPPSKEAEEAAAEAAPAP